jgi:flagellin
MSTNSISSNYAAVIALQGLDQAVADLNATQSKVSTGLAIGSAADNAPVWGIARDQSNAAGTLDSVKLSLQRSQSALYVAIAGGQSVSDILDRIRSKTLAATDTSISAADRTVLNNDVQSLIKQISNVVDSATFNGANLIQSGATSLSTLTDANASVYTVQPQSLAVGGPNITFTAGASFATATQASLLLSQVTASVAKVNSAVSSLGVSSNSVTAHLTFVSRFQDTLTAGSGSLVDADVAKESAALTALQIKQSLAAQTLNITNSAPQILIGLFR